MVSPADPHSTATLLYISEMVQELRAMAVAEKRDFLVYLLEMAHIEASNSSKGLADTPRISSVNSQQKAKLAAQRLAELYLADEYD